MLPNGVRSNVASRAFLYVFRDDGMDSAPCSLQRAINLDIAIIVMCGSDRRTSSTSLNFIILPGRDMMTCRESTRDLCLNYMDV